MRIEQLEWELRVGDYRHVVERDFPTRPAPEIRLHDRPLAPLEALRRDLLALFAVPPALIGRL